MFDGKECDVKEYVLFPCQPLFAKNCTVWFYIHVPITVWYENTVIQKKLCFKVRTVYPDWRIMTRHRWNSMIAMTWLNLYSCIFSSLYVWRESIVFKVSYSISTNTRCHASVVIQLMLLTLAVMYHVTVSNIFAHNPTWPASS